MGDAPTSVCPGAPFSGHAEFPRDLGHCASLQMSSEEQRDRRLVRYLLELFDGLPSGPDQQATQSLCLGKRLGLVDGTLYRWQAGQA